MSLENPWYTKIPHIMKPWPIYLEKQTRFATVFYEKRNKHKSELLS